MRTTTSTGKVAHDVTGWRCEQLVRAGFPVTSAASLAVDARYDLHALIDLVDRGCDPEVATRILTPLDEDDLR